MGCADERGQFEVWEEGLLLWALLFRELFLPSRHPVHLESELMNKELFEQVRVGDIIIYLADLGGTSVDKNLASIPCKVAGVTDGPRLTLVLFRPPEVRRSSQIRSGEITIHGVSFDEADVGFCYIHSTSWMAFYAFILRAGRILR